MTTAEQVEMMGVYERAHTLRATRERIGWTQQDAAERFGVNRRTIARWETPDGKSWVPDEVLTAILERLRILRIAVDDLARSEQVRALLHEGREVFLAVPDSRDVSGVAYREAMAQAAMKADYIESRGGSVRWL